MNWRKLAINASLFLIATWSAEYIHAESGFIILPVAFSLISIYYFLKTWQVVNTWIMRRGKDG